MSDDIDDVTKFMCEKIFIELKRVSSYAGKSPECMYLSDDVYKILLRELRTFRLIKELDQIWEDDTYLGIRVIRVRARGYIGFGLPKHSVYVPLEELRSIKLLGGG